MFKRKSKKEKFTAWDAIEELVKHDDDILEILQSQQEAIKELEKICRNIAKARFRVYEQEQGSVIHWVFSFRKIYKYLYEQKF